MPEPLKRKLKAKSLAVGSWISLASEEVCEIMTQGPFEWLAIDMEHTAIGVNEMARLIRVIDLAGVTPIVRVGANDPLLIKQALDSGAHGIIVPMVNSAADAERAVASAYYPPRGQRGVGLHRAQGYGRRFQEYCQWMDRELVVIAQIEHRDGVAHLDAIMATQGLDAFFIGPYDLSASFGRPGAFDDPEVAAAMAAVDRAVQSGPIAGGMHVVDPNPDELAARVAAGHRLIAFGVDMVLLNRAVADAGTAIADASAKS